MANNLKHSIERKFINGKSEIDGELCKNRVMKTWKNKIKNYYFKC